MDRGRATLTLSPRLSDSLRSRQGLRGHRGCHRSGSWSIAGAAWKVRLDAARDVRVPPLSRASLSRARRAKNIARRGRARPSTARAASNPA